jgi:hypothetical protein
MEHIMSTCSFTYSRMFLFFELTMFYCAETLYKQEKNNNNKLIQLRCVTFVLGTADVHK